MAPTLGRQDTTDPVLQPHCDNFDPRPACLIESANARLMCITEMVKQHLPSAVALHVLEDGDSASADYEQANYTPVASLSEMATQFLETHTHLSNDQLNQEFVSSLQFTSDDATNLEALTKGQSSNHNWNKQRFGRITASKIQTYSLKRNYRQE